MTKEENRARNKKYYTPEKKEKYMKHDRGATYQYYNRKQKLLCVLTEGKCRNCGKEETLLGHHIIPTEKGGGDTQYNLMCLCNSCHQKLHYRIRNIDDHREIIDYTNRWIRGEVK